MDSSGRPTGLVDSGVHQLVSAGTGSGESRRVLVPQIATWDGAVCAVSAS